MFRAGAGSTPAREYPVAADRAVNVTTVPLVNALLHVLPQLMPAGLLVTVPLELSEPFRVTVSLNVVAPAVTVNGNAFDGDVPGFTTVT